MLCGELGVATAVNVWTAGVVADARLDHAAGSASAMATTAIEERVPILRMPSPSLRLDRARRRLDGRSASASRSHRDVGNVGGSARET